MLFGEYINKKRQQKGKTLRGFAEELDISPSYLSDIENGNRSAPNQDVLNKMIELLELNKEESNKLLDLAAASKETVADDLKEMINENETLRDFLRRLRDSHSGDEWYVVFDRMLQMGENKQ